MFNFEALKKSNYSLPESIKSYAIITIEMLFLIISASTIAMVFVFFAQSLLLLTGTKDVLFAQISFYVFVLLIMYLLTMSLLKAIVALIYGEVLTLSESIHRTLKYFPRLLQFFVIVFGTMVILYLPFIFIDNIIFIFPYKVLLIVALIAIIPYIYYTPWAIILRDASLIGGFKFSFYMVRERWIKTICSIIVQLLFTLVVSFWGYFLLLILFFPNNSTYIDNLMLFGPLAIVNQTPNIFWSFFFWQGGQIFMFIATCATFVATNSILFFYLEGSFFKTIDTNEEYTQKIKQALEKLGIKFVDLLEKAKQEKEKLPKENVADADAMQEEALREFYKETWGQDNPFFPEYLIEKKKNKDITISNSVISEDEYPSKPSEPKK